MERKNPNLIKNKKGLATAELFGFIIIVFALLVVIGLFTFYFNFITTTLQSGGQAGAVNLGNITGSTLGQINTALVDKLNLIGIMIVGGMVLGMLINAYITRHQYPKILFIVDILIIFLAFVISTYISNLYETIIRTSQFQAFFTASFNTPSLFMLKLPIFVVVIGILILILSYSDIPKSLKEEQFIGGV